MFKDLIRSFEDDRSFSQYDSTEVYRFAIVTTWLTVMSFAAAFFAFKMWFGFWVLLVGGALLLPYCYYLAIGRDNPPLGRVLYVITSNIMALLTSLSGGNQTNAELYIIALTIVSVIFFSSHQKLLSVICLGSIITSWVLMQFDPSLILPEAYIVHSYPAHVLKVMSFFGSLGLSVVYLVYHIRTLEKHHRKIRNHMAESHRAKEAALDLLAKIADNVPGTVYQYRRTADGATSFPYASRGIEQIYRVSPAEVEHSAEAVLKLLHPEDVSEIVTTIERSAQELTPWRCDYRVRFDDGTVEWRRGIARPEREADGATLWHGFITDITAEKKLEEELRQIQINAIHNARLASLGEMAGGIAHEINNPLSIISSKATLIQMLLEESPPRTPEVNAQLEQLNATIFRIAGIVKGLLTFARGERSQDMRPVQVEDLFREVGFLCSEKAKARGIDLKFEAASDLCINAKAVQLSQVLVNLINNAIDAVAKDETPWITVLAKARGTDKVCFTVSDSGLGIPESVAEKLMQPFFTTKPTGEGTGLGLSISKGLVEAHGGQLVFDRSAPHTTFSFELPVAKGVLKQVS